MHTCCLGTDAERQPRSSFCSSAADLKFLHRLRQTHFRNFKSKSGTRIICLLVPLLLPKFVSEGAAMYHELRKRGTRTGVSAILAALAILVALTATADAQSYPTRLIKLMHGFPPGGNVDVVARLMAQEMSKSLGQT